MVLCPQLEEYMDLAIKGQAEVSTIITSNDVLGNIVISISKVLIAVITLLPEDILKVPFEL